MQHNRIQDRGQVLIIFVFAVVGLIGMTGLAIDGGNIFSDRRHAQNAADTAALSAALTKVHAQKGMHDHPVDYAGWGDCSDLGTPGDPTDLPSTCGSRVINVALDMALSNGYSNDLIDSTVQVHIPPTEGPYSVSDGSFDPYDYVEVIIDTNVNTFFARVLGVPQLHNHVQAVARAQYRPPGALYGGNTLVSLKPGGDDCSGDFDLGGSSTVTLIGGGIFVNSDNTCAAFKEESSCVTLKFYDTSTPPVLIYPVYDSYGHIIQTGTIEGVAGAGSQTSSCPNAPALTHDNEQYPYPPEDLLDEPAECGYGPVGNHEDADGYSHLHPGHYASLPPTKNARLDPGVYCVDNLVKVTNPQSHFDGQGIMLYIRDGGIFDFQGGQMNLSASTDPLSPYKGYLIYVAHDFSDWTLGAPAPNCQINGNAASTFKGTIYAPFCDVVINGTSEAQGFMAQIIAYTISLSGDTALTFRYNAADMGVDPGVENMGLSR